MKTKVNPFEVLGDAEMYDVAAAMRGPDGDYEALKDVFTARIRYLVGIKPQGLLRIRKKKAITKAMLRNATQEVITAMNPRTIQHYIMHVEYALQRLRDRGIISAPEYKFLLPIIDTIRSYTTGYKYKEDLENLVDYMYYHHQPAFMR